GVLSRARDFDDLFQGEAFPRCAEVRMGGERLRVSESGQRMKKSGITNVKLGAFHQTLPRIRMPRREQTDHEGLLKNLEIVQDSLVAHSQRSPYFGRVPGLPMIMGRHDPESPHLRSGEPQTQVG